MFVFLADNFVNLLYKNGNIIERKCVEMKIIKHSLE